MCRSLPFFVPNKYGVIQVSQNSDNMVHGNNGVKKIVEVNPFLDLLRGWPFDNRDIPLQKIVHQPSRSESSKVSPDLCASTYLMVLPWRNPSSPTTCCNHGWGIQYHPCHTARPSLHESRRRAQSIRIIYQDRTSRAKLLDQTK